MTPSAVQVELLPPVVDRLRDRVPRRLMVRIPERDRVFGRGQAILRARRCGRRGRRLGLLRGAGVGARGRVRVRPSALEAAQPRVSSRCRTSWRAARPLAGPASRVRRRRAWCALRRGRSGSVARGIAPSSRSRPGAPYRSQAWRPSRAPPPTHPCRHRWRGRSPPQAATSESARRAALRPSAGGVPDHVIDAAARPWSLPFRLGTRPAPPEPHLLSARRWPATNRPLTPVTLCPGRAPAIIFTP